MDSDRPDGPITPAEGTEERPHRDRAATRHPRNLTTHEVAERIVDAAIEAEYETGDREETEEQARRGVLIRLARIIGGFVIIGMGIAALVFPGPGWLLIIVGLSLLPFAWAERTIRLIRKKIPGVPEEGRIPTSSLIVMGMLLVGTLAISLLFGTEITNWISGLWGDPDKLIT
jgi:hypothetical protein